MRMMMRSRLDVEAANLVIADGSIGPTLDKLFEYCRPETTFFLVEEGKRTIYALFDMAGADQIPVIAETMFHAFGATVDLHPVMTGPDLQAGLTAWVASR